jgi:hypothetical protein
MRYQPNDRPDRGHVGEKWNRYYLRSMQVILQATKGIVSGSPSFFRRAFGDTFEEYESLLLRPHRYIFNREWYEAMGGQSEFEQYQTSMARLSEGQRGELLALLAGNDPWDYASVAMHHLDPRVRDIVLGHYLPLSREGEREIWEKARAARAAAAADADALPDDVRVEDAGLYDDEVAPGDAEDEAPSARESDPARRSSGRRVAARVTVGAVA